MKTKMELVQETLHEHTKSLAMLRDILSQYVDANDTLRKRVADLEARVAYYTNDDVKIIQPRH